MHAARGSGSRGAGMGAGLCCDMHPVFILYSSLDGLPRGDRQAVLVRRDEKKRGERAEIGRT